MPPMSFRAIPWLLVLVAYWTFGSSVDVVVYVVLSLCAYGDEAFRCLVPPGLFELGLRLVMLVLPAYIGSLLITLALGAESLRWTGPGKALLFRAKTTHTGTSPRRHSSTYSCLVVGVPVGWDGCAGGMVSSGVREPSCWSAWLPLSAAFRKGWYDVDPASHLDRRGRGLGLRGKLDAYLKSQGADPAAYPHAYLVTAGKFLGYALNPVSFWFLYDDTVSLTTMVLEVNNMFGEHRMYLLTPAGAHAERIDDSTRGEVARSGSKGASKGPKVFEQAWPEDFHVSPFNSRRGTYSLSAVDPLAALSEGGTPINITATRRSSKGQAKLVARVVATDPPLDPTAMSSWQKFKFLSSWWWVGLATVPQIIKEAVVLYFEKGLHVWYRPEPLRDSMAREADATERRLEVLFRLYLRHLVEQCRVAVKLNYIPGGMPASAGEVMLSSPARASLDDCPRLDFQVLTPSFYKRFVYYAHDLEALFSELRESGTIWVSRPELLPKLVFRAPSPPLAAADHVDFACFTVIRRMRRWPVRIERPLASAPAPPGTHVVTDIRGFRMSAMDAYFLARGDARARRAYRGLVLKLFIADRVARGSVALLEAQHLFLSLGLSAVILYCLGARGADTSY